MDANGVKLRGFITHNGTPYGARVIWRDRVLYVLRSTTDVAVFQDVEQPKRWGGGWKARIGEQALQIVRPGCVCKKDPALSALSFEDILAMASVEVG